MASSEGKKNGRRLFSFDTLSRSSPIEAAHSRHQHSKPSLQHLINDEEIKGEPTGSSQETWTGIDLSGPPLASGKSSSRASSSIPERKRKPAPLRSTTPDAIVPTSSSRKRWEQLRQHVLPVPSHSNTPPVADLPPVAFQTLPLPTRSQTPVQKPSRLARLGFRHVVEHAREVDESRKTSQEFEKVCWAIRMAEPQKMKVDPNTTGSSLHLTFMSHTSLASDGTSILERHPHTHKKHDLRRPQSVQSLTTYRNIPTVKPLCQLLLHHATPSLERRTTFSTLPHESLVLSTLLIPFLSMEESPRLEEERWNAIEAFETITRSWAPHNEEKGIERYLWCCKAAIIPPGTMRTRILSILWGLIIPTDNNYVISTPQCFQTLAQGLFSLLPHLRPLSSSPIDHEEVPFLMDVISRICDGCCGELEAHFAQEEYGTVSSAKDDKNLIREAILFEALTRCLEDCTNDSRVWLFQHVVEVNIVSKFLPDFWIRDAEMVSVALMSDSVKKAPEAERKTWTKQKLGQAVVMLELIAFIQSARHEKEAASSSNSLLAETVKFVVALEARLAILLEAKERTASLAMSRRLLFCVLFREMRLLTRSLKPTLWLAQIVRWCIDIYTDDGTSFDPEEEQKSTTSQIQVLYAAAQDGIRSTTQRRSTMVLSKSLQKPQSAEDETSRTSDLAAMFAQREPLITSISKGFVRKAMKLLVTMSTLLTQSEYRRLASYLWDLLQDDGDASLTAAVCFLVMQCAEKTPMDLLAVIEVNLQSSDEDTKLNAVHKIGIIFNWRYQIISPHIIADRARRPFKAARGPLSFVSTDIGSTAYIRKDDTNDVKDNFPAELRKRLAEIGWNHDDAPVDQHQEWIKVPISLLSSQQLDHLENIGPDIAPPPSPTMLNLGLLTSLTGEKVEDTGLLRRSSSTGGPIHMLKRRAVFVPSLTLVFPRLASLVFDPSLSISSAARSTMLDIMRNDPTLISRPVLDLFAGEQKDIQSAVVTLNAFLHVQRVLPYPMSHFLFNNVAGFLKWTSRQSEEADALQDFAHVVPILTRLVTQVSGLSVRDIRRAKIEPFLIPSGSLWFPSSAPSGPMFPRSLGSNRDPFENLPSDLVSITIIRVSQNMLLLAMLKRNRHDVQLVRKSMSPLELPTITIDQSPLELADFVPFRGKKEQASPSLTGLSITLSRSYILLVAQVFRSMSRHLNDRNELAVLVDGLNRVLLVHGNDIGIVSQVIIALMVASTRFRRLFTSGGGYVLFMPVLLKVYTESQGRTGIKLAIEYGVNRFYALHQESFVFQTLDILAHVTALPHIDVEPLVKSLYNLFFALRKGVLPSTPDAAGIHNANRVQEREALIMNTAEGEPQTFLTLLRRNQAIGENQHLVLELPEEYETNRLGMDDFVRLFLTVIAHDSSIIRAEQFLRLLRILTPHLYHASSNARAILQGGIDALAILLMKTSVKLKASESSEGIFSPLSDKILENRLLEKSRSESNIMTMRLDFLALLIAFVRAGGLLSLASMLRTTELIRTMLKEVPMDINYSISNFIPSFIHASFMRESPPPLKVVVTFLEELSPLITNYSPVVDFSSAFQTISELVASSTYSNQPQFSRAVVSCICVPALLSCEMAASSNILMSLPSRFSIVTLIAQCIFLRGANVIAEVEKRIPSYDYLAGVVLPLVFSLKTEAILDRDGQLDTWHRDAIRSAWIRLLSFTMSTCRTTPRPLERSRSQDRRRSNDSKRPPPPSFLIALQIIKVIIVRVGFEISSRIPSIWLRLRAFLVDILANGNASFATNNSEMSTFPSPTHSPRSSVHLDPFQSSVSSNFLPALHPRSFSHPRIIDYSLWSFLEILCIHRNPLVLQMRLFVMEKLVELDHDLRHQHHDPRGRRVSTSVFSKPRRGMPSPTSPDSSPLLNASQSSPQHLYPNPSLVSLEADRQPGYNVLSSPHNIRGPKIVHLGPISAFGRTLSPGRGGKELNGMTTTTKIKSVALACATYKRIRTVQKFMGYEDLLPMPQNRGIDGDDMITTMWTQREVLDAIRRETEELLKEFEESDPSLEDGGGLVNPPQMGSP
ncbi:hypothetical protein C0989_006338 [Termitomyces sp. Mn162]|nr:hypothetical protein C0989_006338 [Termitomyces sp. Mn162]